MLEPIYYFRVFIVTGAKRIKKYDPLISEIEPLHPKVRIIGIHSAKSRIEIILAKQPTDVKSKFICTLTILKEELIALEELRETTIPTQVDEMDWCKVVQKPCHINLSVVHEFYHKINSQNSIDNQEKGGLSCTCAAYRR